MEMNNHCRTRSNRTRSPGACLFARTVDKKKKKKESLYYFRLGFYYCHLLAYLISSESGNYAQGILSEASNSMMLHTILGGATVRFPSYSALLAASVWEDSVPELWG